MEKTKDTSIPPASQLIGSFRRASRWLADSSDRLGDSMAAWLFPRAFIWLIPTGSRLVVHVIGWLIVDWLAHSAA